VGIRQSSRGTLILGMSANGKLLGCCPSHESSNPSVPVASGVDKPAR
jgi:hypothetical protein